MEITSIKGEFDLKRLYRILLMVYLPNEIINLILSFREVNPVSLLIKDSVERCIEMADCMECTNDMFVSCPFYFTSLFLHQNTIFINRYERLHDYYERKNKKLTNKKKMKGIKFTRNESIDIGLKKDIGIISNKYIIKNAEMRNRYFKLYNLE